MESEIGNLLGNNGRLIDTGAAYIGIIRDLPDGGNPHETFGIIWDAYQRHPSRNNNMNGRIFEYAVCESLAKHGITNLYYQCKLWSMPRDVIDVCGWATGGFPVAISCKTSLRERWKQAELEGRILKGLFPNARSYIVTVERNEARRLERRIDSGEAIGFDRVCIADDESFDTLCEDLRDLNLQPPEKIVPLKGARFVS